MDLSSSSQILKIQIAFASFEAIGFTGCIQIKWLDLSAFPKRSSKSELNHSMIEN